MRDTQLRLWQDDDAVGDALRRQHDTSPPAVCNHSPMPAAAQPDDADAATTAIQPPPAEPPPLLTSGVIAAELGTTLARVRHILRSRPDIQPAAYAGQTRVYRREVVARVRHELNAIDARCSTWRCREW